MGQQQSSDKYSRKISGSEYKSSSANLSQNGSQYFKYNSSGNLDNVNDNIKKKGKNYIVPIKAKDHDKILRINDLLYNSKLKGEKEDETTSKINKKSDFLNKTTNSVDYGISSDNILRNSIRNDVGSSSDLKNTAIPRAHLNSDNIYSNSINSNTNNTNNTNITTTTTTTTTTNNNNYNPLNYSIPYIGASSSSSNNDNYNNIVEFNRHSSIDREENGSSINNHHSLSSPGGDDNITHHWRISGEHNINRSINSNNDDNNFNSNGNGNNNNIVAYNYNNAINERQTSRIQIIQDIQGSETNLFSINNHFNESPNRISNPITMRTRNNNGEDETTFIYQNENSNTNDYRMRVSSSSSNTSINNNSNSNSDNDSNNDNSSSGNTEIISATNIEINENLKKNNKNLNISNKHKETTTVSLSYQNLSILPNYVFELKNLVFLDITHNSLRELPLKLFKLKNLKKLACSDNLLEQVPNEIQNLKKLTWLDFTHNRLQIIPEAIGNLTELVGLGLSDCRLTKLPYNIKNLKSLTKLGVFNNNLTWIPPEIGCLESLIKLDLSSNKLQKIPTEIKFLKNLQWLNLSDNKLKELPVEMSELKNLKELGLGHNFLKYIPDLSRLKKLVMLPIYSNHLEYIGNWICDMKSLEKLDLSDNRLTFIPPGIFKLPKLNYLNIKNNQLRHISCDFCLYSSFSQIDLSSSLEMIKDENMDKNIIIYPYLNNLPLSKLDFLDLSHNQLTYIPSILTKLTLSVMKYQNNKFNSLFKQTSTDFNIKFKPNLSSDIPIILIKEVSSNYTDINNYINDEYYSQHKKEEKCTNNLIPPLSFFDEILLAEQEKNNNKNKVKTSIVSTIPRTMNILLPSKELLPKTFSSGEYIQVIPSKSFPTLTSICINHLFKKYSRKCNPRFCKYHNDHLNSAYSFIKLCDTISNSNISQSVSSSEESIYYNKISTPKDLKYLGSINELNITLGESYFELLKQSDLDYLNSKLNFENSKEYSIDDYQDEEKALPSPQTHNDSAKKSGNSFSTFKKNKKSKAKINEIKNNKVDSYSHEPNNELIVRHDNSSSLASFASINDDIIDDSQGSSNVVKFKKEKQQNSITKFRHLIGKSSTKNKKGKDKGKRKIKDNRNSSNSSSNDSSSNIVYLGSVNSTCNSNGNHTKYTKKNESIVLEERQKDINENAIPPIYNNYTITKPSKALLEYQDGNNKNVRTNLESTSINNSINSLNSTSAFSSMNYLVKPTKYCLHALYSLLKTLPEYTQYAFKHALICDVCGNNYVTNESIHYFRNQYHQSIRSLTKKAIKPSPYHNNTEEHLNKIEEEDIQNVIEDYGSLRILHWKIQEVVDQVNLDIDDIQQFNGPLPQQDQQTQSLSIPTQSHQFTIAVDSQSEEINNNQISSHISSSPLQVMYDDLNTKSFENFVPYNYRICSHSCMKKLINYLNLHHD